MKKIFALLLCAALLTVAVSCAPAEVDGEETSMENDTLDGGDDTEGGAASAPDTAYLHIVESGAARIPMITASRASDAELAAGQKLFAAVAEKTGVYLDFSADYAAETPYELLIGDTARAETAALFSELDPYEFGISVTESKLVIVGWNDACLMEGVDYFLSNFLDGENGALGEGSFRVRIGTKYISNASENAAFYESLLASDTLLPGYTEHLYTIEKPSGMTWQQGGCVLDGYFYQAFIRKDTASNEANNDVIIVKCDLETGKVAQSSEKLQLNHANDITYNSKLGYFVVCHNNPNRTWVSYVDPATLTVVDTKTIGQKIYCIDYNASTDRYVVGCSGGQTFRILNGDLSFGSEIFEPTSRSSKCTTQSVTSDDQYIYFALYNPNLITVYDWEGNFVTLIELDVGSAEPESIAIVHNEIYVGCGTSSGTKIYKIGALTPKN